MGGDRSTRTLGPGARREGSGRSGWSVHGIFILLNPLKSENVLGSKNALLWGGGSSLPGIWSQRVMCVAGGGGGGGDGRVGE